MTPHSTIVRGRAEAPQAAHTSKKSQTEFTHIHLFIHFRCSRSAAQSMFVPRHTATKSIPMCGSPVARITAPQTGPHRLRRRWPESHQSPPPRWPETWNGLCRHGIERGEACTPCRTQQTDCRIDCRLFRTKTSARPAESKAPPCSMPGISRRSSASAATLRPVSDDAAGVETRRGEDRRRGIDQPHRKGSRFPRLRR